MTKLTIKQRVLKALSSGKIEIHPHARKRLCEKDLIDTDVFAALRNGIHDPSKDSIIRGNWRYRISGKAVDGKDLSLAIELGDQPDLLIITVIN